ncbi:hypothetical protein IMX07_16320 [bacterium]|nr:hypothetical protein [bacterium]
MTVLDHWLIFASGIGALLIAAWFRLRGKTTPCPPQTLVNIGLLFMIVALLQTSWKLYGEMNQVTAGIETFDRTTQELQLKEQQEAARVEELESELKQAKVMADEDSKRIKSLEQRISHLS